MLFRNFSQVLDCCDVDNSLVQGALASYYYLMPQEDFFVQKNYSNNNKNVAVELLPKYKTHGGTGRWNDQSRKKHHLEQAKKLKVTRKFVMELFKKEKELGKTIDVGSKIRDKAGIYRKKKTPFNTTNIAKNMRKIKTHRVECTAKLTPMCLKLFVTNEESTICLRCQNVRV